MKKILCLVLLGLVSVYLVGCSGWAIRTSTSMQPRVDQEASGNRGMIFGQDTSEPKKPTFTERKVYKVEIELPDLKPTIVKIKKILKSHLSKRVPTQDKTLWGNRGYIFGASGHTPAKEQRSLDIPQKDATKMVPPVSDEKKESFYEEKQTQTYTVKKGDTLQKISRKFYGTTKKWAVIYKANRDKLKTPDSLYPGNVLIIPQISESEK